MDTKVVRDLPGGQKTDGRTRKTFCRWMLFLAIVTSISCTGQGPPRDDGSRALAGVAEQNEWVVGDDCSPVDDPTLPPRVGCVSVVSKGDLTLTVYAVVESADRPKRWHARVRGPGVDAQGNLGKRLGYPRAVGASDVDLDGHVEWWIKMGDYMSHGAPWAYLNLFFVEGSKLEPLLLDGQPLPINYGGVSRLGEGAECRDGNLVLLRAEAKDRRNLRWIASQRTLSIDGHEATLLGREEDVVVVDHYVDQRIRRYFRVHCQGDTFSPF